MDREFFVLNVKTLCKKRNIPTTTACEASGAGRNIISDINKGKTPSVEKIQLLAEYLGVTTSELLGETDQTSDNEKKTVPPKGDGRREKFAQLFAGLTQEQQDLVIGMMKGLLGVK